MIRQKLVIDIDIDNVENDSVKYWLKLCVQNPDVFITPQSVSTHSLAPNILHIWILATALLHVSQGAPAGGLAGCEAPQCPGRDGGRHWGRHRGRDWGRPGQAVRPPPRSGGDIQPPQRSSWWPGTGPLNTLITNIYFFRIPSQQENVYTNLINVFCKD